MNELVFLNEGNGESGIEEKNMVNKFLRKQDKQFLKIEKYDSGKKRKIQATPAKTVLCFFLGGFQTSEILSWARGTAGNVMLLRSFWAFWITSVHVIHLYEAFFIYARI